MVEGGRVGWRRERSGGGAGGGGGGGVDGGTSRADGEKENAETEKLRKRKEKGGGGCLPPLNLLVLALNMIQMLSSLLFCSPTRTPAPLRPS